MQNLKSLKNQDKKGASSVNRLNIDYQGRRNPIPSRAKIIGGYISAAKFFAEREAYHKDASIWYINESEEMLEKADQETQRAGICADNRSQYLELASIAIAKSKGWLND